METAVSQPNFARCCNAGTASKFSYDSNNLRATIYSANKQVRGAAALGLRCRRARYGFGATGAAPSQRRHVTVWHKGEMKQVT